MKLKYTYIFFVGLLIWAAISSNSAGMGNTSSDCASCHKGGTGTTLIDSLVFIDNITGARTNSSYIPGRTYNVSIYGKNSNTLTGFGFQVNNRGKGTFSSNPSGTMIADSIWGHNATLAGISGVYTKSAQWTAPSAGSGAITFKSILCAVNSNGDTAGDASSTIFSKTLNETIFVAGANITSSASGSTCAGKSIKFVCTPTNGGASPSYNWKVNGVSVGVTTDTFITNTLANNDAVSCVMTSSLVGVVGSPVTSNLLTVSITSNYNNSLTIASPPNDSVCAGASKTFTATPSVGATLPRYQWYLNGMPLTGKTNNSLVQVGFNNNDLILCKMIVSNVCPLVDTAVSNTKTMILKASPLLSGAIDQTMCNGHFTGTTIFLKSPPSATITWTNSKTSIGLAANGTKDTILAFKAINSGNVIDTAYITVTVSNGVCTNYPTVMKYIVNPTPKTFVPKSSTLCSNIAQPLIPITSNVAGASILWTNSNTAIGLDPSGNGSLPAFIATNNTLDSLTATITAKSIFNSCTGNDTSFNITVYPLPILNKIDSVKVCNDIFVDTIKFKANIPSSKITWSNSLPAIGLAANGTTAFTPKFKAINAGTTPINANVTVKVTYKTCSGPDSIFKITVQPNKPLTVAISSTSAAELCFNDTVKFKSTISAGVINPVYQWNINGTPIVGENKDSLVRASWMPLDTVTLTLSTNNSCVAIPTVVSNKKTFKFYTNVNPTIALFSKDTICSGTSITFTTKDTLKGLAPVYQWKKNSTVVGTNTSTLTRTDIANGDTIACFLTSSFSCATPKTVVAKKIMTVIQSVIPTVAIVKDMTKICSGDSVTFTPSVTNGGSTPKYSWSFNSTIVDTNLSVRKFSIKNTTDNATFSMTSSMMCANPKTVSLKATLPNIGLLTGITIQPSLVDSFCYNDSSMVAINSNLTGLTYQWSNGFTTKSFYSKTTQSYTVTVTESVNNCSAVFGPVTTHRNPLQLKPVIQLYNGVLTASYGARYRWFENGTEMPGKITNSISVLGSTSKYKVIAYNYGNCSDTSDEFDMSKLAIASTSQDQTISIYPMPIKEGSFTLDFANNIDSKFIEIFDLKGDKIYEIESKESKVKVTLVKATAGIYLLKATSKNKEYIQKIIVE